MRISDWSSDVCSSDLKGIGGANGGSIDRWFEILFVVAAMLAIATAARFFCITVLAERIVADIRKQVFSHLMHLDRSEEHTSELQSLMRISYAVFCLKKKKNNKNTSVNTHTSHTTINH